MGREREGEGEGEGRGAPEGDLADSLNGDLAFDGLDGLALVRTLLGLVVHVR